MEKRSPIDFLFNPSSVAVIGASRTPGKIGNNILANLLKLGYGGKIYPVNPSVSEILGLPVYPTVMSIPEGVELAVIALPVRLVLDVVMECAARRVRGLVIISSGFNDIGGEGTERQRELLEIAHAAGMRIVGPNTTGILNPYARFTTSFAEMGDVRAGPVAFISQTGMFAGLMLHHIMTAELFGLSKVAGLGNKSDVNDQEVLEYLERDEATRVIMMYVEGVKDGREFLETARRLTAEKPITVLKVGKTEDGARAALSHTGSLTGKDEIFDAACRQAGIVRADDFSELVDFAKMFAYQPVPRGNRTAIVTLSMGAGALAADFCYQKGLRLAEMDERSYKRVAEKSPDWAKVSNPVDIEPLVELVGAGEGYETAVEAAMADEAVDICLIIIGTLLTDEKDIHFLERMKRSYPGKAMAVCVIGDTETYGRLFKAIEAYEIPVYPSVVRTVNSLGALLRYRDMHG